MIYRLMKNKKGFVSIETVIVAGLVVALGAFALTEFYATAQGVTATSMDRIADTEWVWFPISIDDGDMTEIEL